MAHLCMRKRVSEGRINVALLERMAGKLGPLLAPTTNKSIGTWAAKCITVSIAWCCIRWETCEPTKSWSTS